MNDMDDGDTIEVDPNPRRSKVNDVTTQVLDEELQVPEKRKASQLSQVQTADGDHPMSDAVDEYDFKSDDFTADDDKENAGEDTQSVITISSEPDQREEEDDMSLSDRPWRKQKWSLEVRQRFERTFCQMYQQMMDNSWEYTELYQREVDAQMLKYIEDFPCAKWAIGAQEAEAAYNRMLTRDRWRKIGVSVYGSSNGAIQPQQQHFSAPPVAHFPHTPQVLHGGILDHHNQAFHHIPLPLPSNGPQQPLQPPHGYVPSPSPFANGVQAHASAPSPKPQQPAPKRKSTSRKEKAASAVSAAGTGERVPSKAMSPLTQTPPPPYPVRPKPAERKPAGKINGKQVRKQAEADVFPWNRDLDFVKERARADWDLSNYDPEILQDMQETRERNSSFVTQQDDNNIERQRQSRLEKTRPTADSAELSDSDSKSKAGRSSQKAKKGDDNSQAGNFGFASAEDTKKANALKLKSPEDIITAAEAGEISSEQCKNIMICWHPDKRGKSEYLDQACFRVYDTLITRQQLSERAVLTRRAAECIIDFCPDLLWRETLLRIQCEGGMGNKETRNRYAMNGCWTDNSTFTKRILAALGQKQSAPQTQSKKATTKAGKEDDSDANPEPASKKTGNQAGRYGPGELEWLRANQEDQVAYAAFFGKTISNRINASLKRSAATDNDDGLTPPTKRRRGSESSEKSRPSKRLLNAPQWNAVNRAALEDEGAVSAQDSDALDAMDED